jgi:hypothetical protein
LLYYQLKLPSCFADVYNTMCGQCEALQISLHPATGFTSKSTHNAVEVFRVQGRALDEVEVGMEFLDTKDTV